MIYFLWKFSTLWDGLMTKNTPLFVSNWNVYAHANLTNYWIPHTPKTKKTKTENVLFLFVSILYIAWVCIFTFLHLVISMLYKWNREFLTNLDYTFQKQSWSKEGNKIGITAVRFLDRLAMVQSRNNPIGSLHHSSCYFNITTLV